MATNTTHLKLLKKDVVTDGNETFNIETMLNDNWDKIDKAFSEIENNMDSIDVPSASTIQPGIVQLTNDLGVSETLAVTQKALNDVATTAATKEEIQTLSETVTAHKNEDATTTNKGHVQLSSAIDSESETLAATPKAIKTAYDLAQSAFQSASDGKSQIATAITGKGVNTSASDTFATMAANIKKIKVGDYSAGDSLSLSQIQRIGVQEWDFTGHTNNVQNLDVDSNGYVYSASKDKTAAKLDGASGKEIWRFTDATSYPLKVSVYNPSTIYLGTFGGLVIQLNGNGQKVWQYDMSSAVFAVGSGSSDSVYCGMLNKTLVKLKSTGASKTWTYTGFTGRVNDVKVQGDYVYACSEDGTVRKITASNGTLVWSYTGHTSDAYAVAVDKSGNVYSVGLSDCTIRKINANGSLVWQYTHSNVLRCVSVDELGNVYVGGNDGYIRKFDAAGNLIWSIRPNGYGLTYTVSVGTSDNVYSGTSNGRVGNLKECYKIIG